jgi:hypothetical protein
MLRQLTARLLSMPIPCLRSTDGPHSEFYCSACNTKFKTQSFSPDMKAAIQREWDDHLSSVHPRPWEREKSERTRRQASRERSARRWRVIVSFSVLGMAIIFLGVGYLWINFPHQNLRVTRILDALCPPSVLTLIYLDVPGTTADYALTGAVVAILNAGLYGAIGAAVTRLLRVRCLIGRSRSRYRLVKSAFTLRTPFGLAPIRHSRRLIVP